MPVRQRQTDAFAFVADLAPFEAQPGRRSERLPGGDTASGGGDQRREYCREVLGGDTIGVGDEPGGTVEDASERPQSVRLDLVSACSSDERDVSVFRRI